MIMQIRIRVFLLCVAIAMSGAISLSGEQQARLLLQDQIVGVRLRRFPHSHSSGYGIVRNQPRGTCRMIPCAETGGRSRRHVATLVEVPHASRSKDLRDSK